MVDPVSYGIDTLRSVYYGGAKILSQSHDQIVDALAGVEWSPTSTNPPPPEPTWIRLIDRLQGNKKSITVGIGCAVALGIGLRWSVGPRKSIKGSPKRRVPKLANGARRDVVLVVGSPTEPLTRLICLDFEKRGFIVYLTLLDSKDVKYIESHPITDDMNYLNLNQPGTVSGSIPTNYLESQLTQFGKLLQQPVVPFAGANSHTLRLASVVFSPSLYFPIGPIENLAISTWHRINDRFLLYCKLLGCGLVHLIRQHQARTVVLNPNIIAQLAMPYHAPETLFSNQMRYLFTILSRELAQVGLAVTQVRVGNLQLSSQVKDSQLKISHLVTSELSSWTQEMKQVYGNSFSKSQYRSNPIRATGGKGTCLRDLYHKLFDIIYMKGTPPTVLYCGTGARSYDWIGRIFPESWIQIFIS
ncbi:hypothetical protein DICA3_C18668 [Diutina catenulata]